MRKTTTPQRLFASAGALGLRFVFGPNATSITGMVSADETGTFGYVELQNIASWQLKRNGVVVSQAPYQFDQGDSYELNVTLTNGAAPAFVKLK